MRVRGLLIPLLATVALGAGCTGWRDEAAATVDGETVTMSELRGEVDTMAEHPDVAGAFQVDVSEGAAASERSAPLVSWLNRRITDLAMDAELERRGITLDDAGRAAAEAELRFQFEVFGQQAAQAGQTASPLEAFDQLPVELRQALIEREATREALAAAVAAEVGDPLPSTAEAWFEANEDAYQQFCVSIIASTDEPTSTALLRRVEAGEDFAALAATESVDAATASQGGDAGCALASQLTPELAEGLGAAEAGEVVGPVELSAGWLLLLVDETSPASFGEAEATARIDRLNARQAALTGWIDQASPSVTVTPRLGTWDAAEFRVQPNPGPQQAATGR